VKSILKRGIITYFLKRLNEGGDFVICDLFVFWNLLFGILLFVVFSFKL
jgi:hypothetical protein